MDQSDLYVLIQTADTWPDDWFVIYVSDVLIVVNKCLM